MQLLDFLQLVASSLTDHARFATSESVTQSASAAVSLGWETVLVAATDSRDALDRFWENELFKKPRWVDLMFWTRTILCLLGALLLIYEVRARRMGADIAVRHKRVLAIALSVIAFGVYFDFGNPNVRYKEYYHRHELYHY